MGNQLGIRRSGMITKDTPNSSVIANKPGIYDALLTASDAAANANQYYRWVGTPQCIPQIPNWATTSDAVFDGYKQMTVKQAIDGTRGWLMHCLGYGTVIHDRHTQAADLPRTWGADRPPAQVKIEVLPPQHQTHNGTFFFTIAIFVPEENYWCTLATKNDAQGTLYAHAPGNDSSIGWEARVPYEYANLKNNHGEFPVTWRHWFYFSRDQNTGSPISARNPAGACWPPIDLALEPWYSFYSQPVFLCGARTNGMGQPLSVGVYDSMQLRLDNRDIPFIYAPDVNHTTQTWKRFKLFCESLSQRKQAIMGGLSDPLDIQISKQMGVWGKRSVAEWDSCAANNNQPVCFDTRNSEATMREFCAQNPNNAACGCTESRIESAFRMQFPSVAAQAYKGTIMGNLACWDNPCATSQAFIFSDQVKAVKGAVCGQPLGCDMPMAEQQQWQSYDECQRQKKEKSDALEKAERERLAAEQTAKEEAEQKRQAELAALAADQAAIAAEQAANAAAQLAAEQAARNAQTEAERQAAQAEQQRLAAEQTALDIEQAKLADAAKQQQSSIPDDEDDEDDSDEGLSTTAIIIIAAVVFVILGGFGYFLATRKKDEPETTGGRCCTADTIVHGGNEFDQQLVLV